MLVETIALTKRYGAVTALRDCTLQVRGGEVFGLLGPNGSGKTTLLRLLMGFLSPSAGSAKIDKLDCYRDSVKIHRQVGYLPSAARTYRAMTGRGVLKLFAQMHPKGDRLRAFQVASRLDLDMTRRVGFMSTGMRQKLGLAMVFSLDTPLVILDEPTSHLDPSVRSEVLAMVGEARRDGRTLLFSSHVLSEVEEISDRVAILRLGELVHTQTMNELRQRHRIRARLRGALPPLPDTLNGDFTLHTGDDGEVTIDTPGELSPVLGWLASLPVEEIRIHPIGLRAVYDQYEKETKVQSPESKVT